MTSEPIVLSSDDDDDGWFTKSHKRNRDLNADNDVVIIEKVPCLETRIFGKGLLALASLAESKLLQGDDECCILNYDPDNRVQVPNFQANEGDELVVVGERGPVACRDFPHARHLCVKFPFTTTSHEKHCDQCHCYVCDVVAPCLRWGQGKQTYDHCHASDKDEKWKIMRNQARCLSKQLPAPSIASMQKVQMTAPQPRILTQSLLRVIGPPRVVKSSTNHLNLNAGLSSHNYRAAVLPGNSQPHIPSKVGAMLGNCSRLPVVQGTNEPRNPHSVVDRMRLFSQNDGAILNSSLAAAMTSVSEPAVVRKSSDQPISSVLGPGGVRLPSYQLPSSSVLTPDSLRNTQSRTSSNVPMLNNGYISGSQVETCTTTCINPSQVQYLSYGVGAPPMISESLGGTTQRVQSQPFLSHLRRDLATLQSYLMEGISGQNQTQSTAVMSTPETHSVQTLACRPGDLVPQEMCNKQSEGLSHLTEPSQTRQFNNSGVGTMALEPTVMFETMQTSKTDGSMLPGAGLSNHEILDHSLCVGNGNDALDQLLASFDDDEFWTLLEPPDAGF